MSMSRIREFYGVSARRGRRIVYNGGFNPHGGVITGSDGLRLRIRLDGEKRSRRFHPTYCLYYL